jgi:hypothetical protein
VRFAVRSTITCLLLISTLFFALPSEAADTLVCDPSIFPTDIRSQVEARVRQAIGGGQIRSGPFSFCVLLYADAALQPHADHPSRMTDIPGVGWTGLWVYRGKALSGNITESWGFAPGGIKPTAGHYRLEPGNWGGRFGGGVPLPEGSRPGDQVRLGIRIATPDGTYGANITFTLTGQGITNVSVSPSQAATPTETLTAFFEAWSTGDRKAAEALLIRPNRLWHDFGRDVKSLRLVKIDRPFRAVEREKEYQERGGFAQVVILRATFDVEFHRDGSMNSGRNVYSYFLVRKWPWSSWRVADWTSQP